MQGEVVSATSIDSGDWDTVPINATATLASPGSITIACGGFDIYVHGSRLTVIRVNGIN